MELEPIVGTPVRIPPGKVAVRLDERYHLPYKRLYQHYRTFLSDMPVLRDHDFDGRSVKMTEKQLRALNAAFAADPPGATRPPGVFDAQERGRTRLIKKTQFLS